MVTVNCDVCRKKMDDPVINRSFFYYADYSVCEACKDSLEVQIKNQIRNKDPFEMDWYGKYVDDIFSKAVQKGKA